MESLPHTYYVYGITLHSEIPLCLPKHGCGELAEVELHSEPASFFSDAIEGVSLEQVSGSWYQVGRTDESHYVRWEGVGEFLIAADGRQMFCRQFDVATSESFQVYMLGQALSYALVGLGFEPIHATVVVVDGEGVGFLGFSGFGKSTLAASFLSAGYPVLTDDLLILQERDGRLFAYPGPPRIKLFPKIARLFLGSAANGVSMNRDTAKLILPLGEQRSSSLPVPIAAMFALAPPREVFRKQAVRLEPLSPREAFVEVVKNTFNYRITESARLERQFAEASRLVSSLPMRKLAIPRNFAELPSVREAILSELQQQPVEVLVCAD
jgi:hypothetical protein